MTGQYKGERDFGGGPAKDTRRRARVAIGPVLLALLAAVQIAAALWQGALAPEAAGRPSAVVALVLLVGAGGLAWAAWRMGRARLGRDGAQRAAAAERGWAAQVEARIGAAGLSPAERAVTLHLLQGHSLAEIAAARQARLGTIKAQSAAIYRKFGVVGRAELAAQVLGWPPESASSTPAAP